MMMYQTTNGPSVIERVLTVAFVVDCHNNGVVVCTTFSNVLCFLKTAEIYSLTAEFAFFLPIKHITPHSTQPDTTTREVEGKKRVSFVVPSRKAQHIMRQRPRRVFTAAEEKQRSSPRNSLRGTSLRTQRLSCVRPLDKRILHAVLKTKLRNALLRI